MQSFKLYNICVTIVRSYTRKYHEFVAICIVTCANGKKQVFCGIVWYYGDNDFIIRNFGFIARSDAARENCST